jgi:hypothetical protein
VLPHKSIEARLQVAVSAVLPGADTGAVLVRPCPDPKFGDYQSNALMALAKERKMNPRQLATDVVAKLDVAEWSRWRSACNPPRVESICSSRRPRSRDRWWLISVSRTSPSPCTSDTSARQFWAIRWRGRCGCWVIRW